MFPLVIRDCVRIPISSSLRDQVVEKYLTQLRLNLRKEKALDISQAGQEVTFTGGPFRLVSQFNVLYFFDKGKVHVGLDGDQLVISYRLSVVVMFITSAMLMAFAGFVVAVVLTNLADKILVVAGLWLFLYWLNLVVAVVRFSRFIDDTLRTVGRKLPDSEWFTL